MCSGRGDDRLRTLQLFGSVHWMWTWFDPAGPRPVAEVAASFVDTFLTGVLVDPAGAAALADPGGAVARRRHRGSGRRIAGAP